MVTVKLDGASISDGPFENFAHAARWFANNGVCHGARKTVVFGNADTQEVSDGQLGYEPKKAVSEAELAEYINMIESLEKDKEAMKRDIGALIAERDALRAENEKLKAAGGEGAAPAAAEDAATAESAATDAPAANPRRGRPPNARPAA